MRVLFLAPPGRDASQLSRYSFLDEEIRGLAEAGVESFVLSPAAGRDTDAGRIHLRAVPADSPRERMATARFALTHAPHIPAANLLDVLPTYRAVREERIAAEVVARERIDLIHSFFARPAGFGGSLAKAATGVPLIAAFRGVDVNTLPALQYGSVLVPSFRRAIQRLMRSADLTLSVSDFVRRDAVALGANPAASHVILKGVRAETFRPAGDRAQARAALGLGPDPLILAVGGLIPIKGYANVLDALAVVRQEGHRFTFAICGEGPERDALEAQAGTRQLEDRCRFPGKVGRADVARYFAAADLFVHGALIEGSGNVLLEAMASGVPVVCTDAGGPAEYVRDGVTGFVVPVGDAAAMARRLAQLLSDPALRDTFARQARALVETQFTYDRMIRQILDAYGMVLPARPRP